MKRNKDTQTLTRVEMEIMNRLWAVENGSASVRELLDMYPEPKLLTDEAERVVRSMPKWEPGIVNGTPARVHFFIPISFNID